MPVQVRGQFHFYGSGSLSAEDPATIKAQTNFAGAGNIIEQAPVLLLDRATVNFAAASNWQAVSTAATVTRTGFATFTGASDAFSPAGQAFFASVAALKGAGNFAPDGWASLLARGAFTGAGALIAAPIEPQAYGFTNFFVSSALTVTAAVIETGVAAPFAGAGGFSADGEFPPTGVVYTGFANFAGQSSLSSGSFYAIFLHGPRTNWISNNSMQGAALAA